MERWLRFARYSTITALQQGIVAVSGIFVVRALSVGEYAQYSVITALMAAVAVVAEGGVVATVMSEGGRRQDDRAAYAVVLRVCERYRLAFVAGASLAVAPLGWYLLTGVNDSGANIVYQGLATVAGAAAMSGSSLYAAALRLELKFDWVSLILLGTATTRLLLVIALAMFGGSGQVLALLLVITVVLFAAEAAIFRRRLPMAPATVHPPDVDVRRALFVNARRVVPNSVFYVAQGQVLSVLLVAAGNPSAVAQVAAVSRYSLVFAVVGGIIAQQFMPRLARAGDVDRARRLWLLGAAGYVGAGVLLIGGLYIFRSPLLWLLGPAYTGLDAALMVNGLAAFVSAAAVLLGSLNQARAWLRFNSVQIPAVTATIILLLIFLRPTDVYSATWFKTLLVIPGVLSALFCAWVGVRDERATPPTP